MKYKLDLSQEEFTAVVRLIVANQNSAKLQKVTYMGYVESIELNNRLSQIKGVEK